VAKKAAKKVAKTIKKSQFLHGTYESPYYAKTIKKSQFLHGIYEPRPARYSCNVGM